MSIFRITVLLALSTFSLFALTPKELAQKGQALGAGFDQSRSEMRMVLVSATGQEAVRRIEGFTLEGPAGSTEAGDKTLVAFLEPADVKGVKFLSHERLDGPNHQWLYLPALRRVKRISSSSKTGSFMGSEFSYEDIASRAVEKYDYPGSVTETAFEGETLLTYTRIPKEEDSGYTRQTVYVDPATSLVRYVQYYDRKEALLKTAKYEGYQNLQGVWRVGKITMTNHQNGKSTVMEYLRQEVKLSLPPQTFTKRALH